MRIAVVRETREGETRVALVPAHVRSLVERGFEVHVETGAGEKADHVDEEYAAAGATVTDDLLKLADVTLSVNPLPTYRARLVREHTVTMSFLAPWSHLDLVGDLRDFRITSFAMDLVPRTARGQAVDAVTSQAMVAGYRGAVVAAGLLRRFLPGAHTAAGVVPPARVLVLGTGVVGLEAVATLRRLGAEVLAHDVRPAYAEEVRSLGATPLDLGLEPLTGEDAYLRRMDDRRLDVLRDRLAPHVVAADAVVTTAAVPGHVPPVLVTRAMVEQMVPGSVVVDLAAESGGNVEGVVAGSMLRVGASSVWGGDNVPAQVPGPASRLYGQNLLNLLDLVVVGDEHGVRFAPDLDDEVVGAACLTHAGEVRHEATRALLGVAS